MAYTEKLSSVGAASVTSKTALEKLSVAVERLESARDGVSSLAVRLCGEGNPSKASPVSPVWSGGALGEVEKYAMRIDELAEAIADDAARVLNRL